MKQGLAVLLAAVLGAAVWRGAARSPEENPPFVPSPGAPAGADRVRAPDPPERAVVLSYRFDVRGLPPGAERVFAWIPVPPATPWQEAGIVAVPAQWPHEILAEGEYGNRALRFDLSKAPSAGGAASVEARFRVVRKAAFALTAPVAVPNPPSPSPRFLMPDGRVPVDGPIASEAEKCAAGRMAPLDRARAVYDAVVETMAYDKTGTGWGQGDALFACDARRGNCTDFHSLFIGMARSLRIPARFVMGLPLPPDADRGAIPGYHCWAEFHLPDRGWVPVDASEAKKHPEKKERFFGGLDAHRVEFSTGRDIRLPKAEGGPLNYFIYPYVEVDGKEFTEVAHRFTFEPALVER